MSVAVLISVAPTYCPLSVLFPSRLLIVTQAHPTVTAPKPSCDMSICVPTGKATEAFVGIVRVIAAAFVRVTSLLASVSTRV